MSIAALAYASCALAFGALTCVALSVWRKRLAGSYLTVAFALQAIWSGLIGLATPATEFSEAFNVACELSRGFAWVLVLAVAIKKTLARSLPPLLLSSIGICGVLLPVLALASPLAETGAALIATLSNLQRWGGLFTAIGGLVVVEQFARNARENARWRLKYVWLGIGLIFAVDLAVWSVALLGMEITERLWFGRAIINLLVSVLFVVAIRRLDAWSSALFKSGGGLFFNTTLLVAGLYVLMMAFASFLLRARGIVDGTLVETTFIGASLVLLSVAIASDQFRAWARVSWSKYMRPFRYDYRDVWLRLTSTLTESNDVSIYDRVAALLASFVSSGSGSLWLRDTEGGYRRIGGSLGVETWPASAPHDGFLESLRVRGWIYDLGESNSMRLSGGGDRAGSEEHLPPSWMVDDGRAWLVVPLVCGEQMIGFVVTSQSVFSSRLHWEQLDILRAAARQVAAYFAFEQTARRLAEVHQFEALNRLSAFVMHDLRHLVAQLALVVENAARHRRNPEFIDDTIVTIENAVGRMKVLMDVLHTGKVHEPMRRVSIREVCLDVQKRCRHRLPIVEVAGLDQIAEVMANRERITQALEHLVRNAQEATPAAGSVTLTVRCTAKKVGIEISDTGSGMTQEFIDSRLFKPFDTTKGQEGMGLGAYEAREIVREFRGSIRVDSRLGVGSRFLIEMPSAPLVQD